MPVVDLTIDSSGATKGLKQYDTAVDKSGKSTDKLSAALKKTKGNFAIMAAAAATAAAALGGAFAVMAVKAASDLEETQGKFDVVFRGMTEQAEGWAETLRDSYGLSETASKKYLSSIQDLLVPTGLARDAAGELSNSFVQMARDLGSFNNLSTEQVIRDIQSALQGSSETMAKYGINVKAAKVEQEIFNAGLATSKEEITDAHKAQAIYNIMMREGADAVGDFARTQDSFANQMEVTKSLIQDFAAGVGKELLPHITAVVKAFNDWAKEGDNLQTMIDGTAKVLLYMAQGAVKTAQGLTLVASAVGVLFGGLLKLLTPLELVLEGLVALEVIDSNPITMMKDAVDDFTQVAISGFQATSEASAALSESIDNIGNESSESAGQVKELTQSVMELAAANATGAASFAELDAMAAAADEQIKQMDEDQKSLGETSEETGNKIEQAMTGKAAPAEQKMQEATVQATGAIKEQTTELAGLGTQASETAAQLDAITQKSIKMSNTFTSSGDAATDLAAKLQTIRELSEITAASNENIFGGIGGAESALHGDLSGAATGTSYSLSGSSDTGVSQSADLISDYVASGGDITQIYINQAVSRSDIVNITNEQDRDTARA